jgi:hypothetical protein
MRWILLRSIELEVCCCVGELGIGREGVIGYGGVFNELWE